MMFRTIEAREAPPARNGRNTLRGAWLRSRTIVVGALFCLNPGAAELAFGAPDPTAEAELGQRLFFDAILSEDRTVRCASCHKPEFAYADDTAYSVGINGTSTTRNVPSAMNTAARVTLFWDGRAGSLEEQALGPIANPAEMGLPIDSAIGRLNADRGYSEAFRRIFGGPATAKTLARAIAAFERTLETANSPYDRYENGDSTALSAAAARGRLLFIGKANCAQCHSGEDFTSDRFKNIGLYNGKDLADRGRGAISGRHEDDGAFKVPSLRNVAVTAPYMHNGMFMTLREVIEYYNNPASKVNDAVNRDPALSGSLGLSDREIADLEAFLYALTDDRFSTKSLASQ
ncbi:MAG: cytochrome c peroxidase [Steroidobacteraceae bacterium]